MLGRFSDRWTPYNDVSVLHGLKETTKPRTVGTTWRRVPHIEMIKSITEAVKAAGLEFDKKNIRFYLSMGNANIAFSLIAKNEEIGTINTKHRGEIIPLYPSVGFVASNAHRQGLVFYGGFASMETNFAHVMLRQKGAKYTVNFDPYTEAKTFVQDWAENLNMLARESRNLQRIEINRNQISRYMTEAGAQNLMPWSRAGKVIDAITGNVCSKWRLLMEFSRVAAMNPPQMQMDQHYFFSALVRNDTPVVDEELKIPAKA